MTDPVPYTVPKQPGGWKAVFLAIVVHLGLVVMLVIGMHWRIEAPAVVEAEIWDIQPREAAPRPEPVRAPPQPPQPQQPEPPPPPPRPVTPPQPQVQTPPVKDPDIVLAEEKKRKEEEERKRKLAEEQKRKQEEERQRKLAEEKKRQEEEQQRKLAEEKKRQEEQQRKLAEEQKRKEEEERKRKLAEEQKRKQEEERQRKLAEEKARQEKLEAERRRKEDMERMMAQVGAGGAGSAPQAQGGRADANYLGRLAAKIKSNTVFATPPDLVGNPAVEYRVELLPDGSVRSIRKLQSSGLTGFDEAVERAIRRSEPFPADNTGSVPSSFTFLHRPRDN